MGRKKLEIKRITDKVSRQVTYSKRKAGLFNKASELATLCAIQICLIVFSPGGRVFHYGFPDVDSIVARFLNEDREVEGDDDEKVIGDDNDDEVAELIDQRLKLEKEKGARLEREVKRLELENKAKVDEASGLAELEEMKRSMEKLMEAITMREKEIETEMEVSSSLLLLAYGPDANV